MDPSEKQRSTSHTSQPVVANPNEMRENSHATVTGKQTASTVLPPFSGDLRVDNGLKLSNDDFKQSVKQFYANKQLSAIDQLKATPPYPTPHVLAQFANMAYLDCTRVKLTLPDGWRLLTTASNFEIENGYFGTAYWHPEHQQVMIAHRGTKNFGAIVTDVEGVLFNNYVQQMSSASTFANKVVTVLQEIEQEKKVSFELFFTGHSLGGWLAQITTFTSEYLQENGGTFLKKQEREEHKPLPSNTAQASHYFTHSYHPHTVVFDSPGCETMLSQMKQTFDVRLHGSSIDFEHLDITSYLSAPNLVNTCNSHLGTVYRIFTDLSDMGWKEKHTLLYNLATHRMDKMVQFFDPKTGQVCKDSKSELKILQVVDWPVSAGLTYGAELTNFFEWAKHLNNYNPQAMDLSQSKVPKGYHPLRYQTKVYDECTKSLGVFTEEEREFLQHYLWLRHVPEFFKPEELFCELNSTEAKKAEEKLQDFRLDNDSVRCSEASILHALIPYLKRLVRLFPNIKESVKDKLSSLQIRNRVYQYETLCNVEKIRQNALEIKPDAMRLGEFLGSEQQMWQLQMIDGDAWTGITKVYWVLQNTSCTPNYSSESKYVLLDVERLLTVNRMINLKALLTSLGTQYLVLIAFGTNLPVNVELRDMFLELLNTLREKKAIKIILTTKSEDSSADVIQQLATETLGERFIKTVEKFSWSDLTATSQRKILEKEVIFQGRKVALNQVTSAESMTDSFPIADLLQEKELRIGEESVPSASNGYNEKYYIDRTFTHNIVIKQDISSEKQEEKFADLLASNEQDFKQFCKKNPTRNVHWLVEDKSGELIWQQSQGNLKTLRQYIDAQKPQSYAPSDLDKLLEQAKEQRVMLIADKAGMGKTTVLTHLSKPIQQNFPANWFVRIDLSKYADILKDHKEKMNKNGVLEFVSKEVLKLESDLEKELFKKTFEGNGVNKLVVLVDGFDEISPSYKETVLDMLQVLKQTSLEQLWITTRPNLRDELEDNLQQLSYTLQPFSVVEQVEFLKKYWIENLNLEDTNQPRLQMYAEALISKLAHSIRDNDREFTGIPLQTRMLAEAFEEEVKLFYQSAKSEPELLHKLDLLGLYRKFIDRKYYIYYKEKSNIQEGNVGAVEIRKRDSGNIEVEHRLLALEALFTEDQVTFLQSYDRSTFPDEDLARIGIVQRNSKGKLQFIHRTFAEFLVAEFLIRQLTKKTKQHTQVQELLLNEVLLRKDFHVIRAFLDGLLEKFKPTEEAMKEYANLLDGQWNRGQIHGLLTGLKITALCQSAREDNATIIGFLFDSLKSGTYFNTLTKMLLTKDHRGLTAWHMAAENNSVLALDKIMEWAEEVTAWLLKGERVHLELLYKIGVCENVVQVTPNEIMSKLLLAKNRDGKTAWLLAAETGSLKSLETLWGWAMKAQLNLHELLLAQDKQECTVWHVAVDNGHLDILDKLCAWAQEVQLNPKELKDKLFLATDKYGNTVWHRASKGGRLKALEKLRGWAKEMQLDTEELKIVLLLSKNKEGETMWELAAQEDNVAVLQKLWDWAKEAQLEQTDLVNDLLLSKDKKGNTAWHRAAMRGRLETLEILRGLAIEVEVNADKLKNMLLLSKNKEGETAWHLAAEGNKAAVLQKLWVWAKQELKQNELMNALLLSKDKNGQNAWHRAAECGSLEALDILWSLAMEVEVNADKLKYILLLSQNKEGETAWHMAAGRNNVAVLQKLWVLVKEELNQNEFMNDLLQLKDKYGNNAWHRAVEWGGLDALEIMWSLAMEAEVNADKLKNMLLLSQNMYGETVWHLAAREEHQIKWHWGNKEGQEIELQKMRDWAKEAQLDQKQLMYELLLAKDSAGNTVWHRAAKYRNLGALQTLWNWATEVKFNPDELKNKLLLSQNENGETAWQLTAIVDYETDRLFVPILGFETREKHEKHEIILQKMWDWAKEAQLKQNELINDLLLSKNKVGYTAFDKAVYWGKIGVVETLWNCAKEVQLDQYEFVKNLLLSKNLIGKLTLNTAAGEGSVSFLQKYCACVKEAQRKTNELDEFLLLREENGNTAWHQAAEKGSIEALETLWSWAKEVELNPDELKNKLLLSQNWGGKTAWHLAAYEGHERVLQKMWEWAKEGQMKQNELKNKLLLGTDKYGNTAWHLAAIRGQLGALETLWRCAEEEEQNPHELKNKLLLSQNEEGITAWQFAAGRGHERVLHKMLDWAKEGQMKPNELNNKLLLATDKYGNTLWHIAANSGRVETIEILRRCAKEAELNPDEFKNNFLLSQNKEGKTVWHLAAGEGNVDLLQKLCVCAKEAQLKQNELMNQLFRTKDKKGNTAWHQAAKSGRLEAIEILWSWAMEVEINPDELKNMLLLSQNEEGKTAWLLAARWEYESKISWRDEGTNKVLQKMWDLAKEAQLKPNELKKILLLATDKYGNTVWHRAVQHGGVEALEILRICAKEAQLDPDELKNELLLSHNEEGETAWQLAARAVYESKEYSSEKEAKDRVLEKMLDLAKGAQLKPNDFKNILFLATDKYGNTAWHRAAKNDRVETLEILWSCAKEAKLHQDELKNDLLLSQNDEGETAWQLAAGRGHGRILQKMWDWAKEAQLKQNELMNELFLTKDKNGNTAWHRAAKRGRLGAIEVLWRCAKEAELNPDELKNKLLLSQNKNGETAWHLAAEGIDERLLQKMWDWAKEAQLKQNEIMNELFLTKDKNGNTAWHRAAKEGELKALELLLSWAMETKMNPDELKNMLLLSKNDEGESSWLLAAKEYETYWGGRTAGKEILLQKMWDWAKEAKLKPSELKNILLLAKDKYGNTAWHRAVQHRTLEGLKILWRCAKEAELNPDELNNKLLLSQNEEGETAWHLAGGKVHAGILQNMWDWVKEAQLKPSESKNILLFATDSYGNTAWHRAAGHGNLETLETFWICAKEAELYPDELKNKLLLSQNKNGETAWHLAASGGYARLLQKMWDWTKEGQLKENELMKELFLTKDKNGNTAWHRAAQHRTLEGLDTLWRCAKELELNADELKNELLLSQNEEGETAWLLAAREHETKWYERPAGQEIVLQKMWDWAKEAQLKPSELKNILLLATDKYRNTAWHQAAQNCSLETLNTLWRCAKEAELNPDELKNELLLSQNEEGETAWLLAAKVYETKSYSRNARQGIVLQKMWDWAKEAQLKQNELINELFLTKDKNGNTAWHRATQHGRLETLETLWRCAKEAELNPDELKNDLLLSQNNEGETVWHLAAGGGHERVLHKMWDWVKEAQLKQNELMNELFLTKDKNGNIAWHRAAKKGGLGALEILWSWAMEAKMNPVELKNNLLLFQNEAGETAWLLAARGEYETEIFSSDKGGNSRILQKIWDWTKEVHLKPSELKNIFLLATDKYGNTAWHQAARRGNLETLNTLWRCAKEAEVNPDELKNELLLSKNNEGETVWHLAAGGGYARLLQKLWDWANAAHVEPSELKNISFLVTDMYGNTAWHRAAQHGNLETLNKLWRCATRANLNPNELKNELFLSRNVEGETVWHLAAGGGHEQVLHKMWDWAKKAQFKQNELMNELFLMKDKNGNTMWHRAAKEFGLWALEILWSWAMEEKINQNELKNMLLLSQNEEGETVWLLAARGEYETKISCPDKGRKSRIFQKIWDWAKEVQLKPIELKKIFLLTTDKYGNTAWHQAAQHGSLQTLNTLWRCAKEAEVNPDELKNDLLLSQNNEGETVWHLAAGGGHERVLHKMWDWVKEAQLKQNELMNELFLTKDKKGNTAWHRAAKEGGLRALEVLCIWAMEAKINPDELNVLLLSQKCGRRNLLALGRQRGICNQNVLATQR